MWKRPEFLGAVVDAVPGLVFVFDEDDGLVWGNRRLRELTGLSVEELRDLGPAALFGRADARAVRKVLAAIRAGEESATVQVALRSDEDETIVCDFTGHRLPTDTELPGTVLGVGRELSRLESRERALRRERDRLAALYSGLPSPVVHYEVEEGEALIRGVNTAFEEVFGLAEDEILGQNLDDLIAPDHRARQAEVLTRRALQEGSVQAEVVRETDEGPHYFRLNSVLFSGDGQPEGYAIYTDITEQKEREQTLRDEQEALREMYRITADQESSFREKIQRLIELGCAYLALPYGFLTRIAEQTQHIVQASGDHPLLQAGEVCPLSESYCRKTIQEESLLAVQNAPAEGWEKDPAYETFRLGAYVGSKILVSGELYGTFCFAGPAPRKEAFTERERTFVELMSRWVSYELEQRHATEELERKNERLDSFASVLSHDLRNPLNVAKGRLELAREKEEWEHLAAVDRALDRMDEIIDDVLALTWGGQDLDSDDLESCNLARLSEECWEHVDMAQAALRTGEGPVVKADKGRLQRLLENLFRNAVEHGEDAVTVRVGPLDDGFYVEDDGPGIPEEQREKVFEAGYSSDKEGTGLGLNIVQTIAASHGWDLFLAEGEEGGARFEFRNVEMDN